jgi:hypothetical protein
MEKMTIGKDNMKHVQAYIDYRNIVGDDDGGKMMSEKEFEAYKKKVAEARKNHLYVYWENKKGYDCKAIGPESQCFCGHRFKGHDFDAVKTKKVKCKTPKCKCAIFDYVPVYGSNDVKCLCKHSHTLHDPFKRNCSKCQCTSFTSKFTCNCTMGYDDHQTTIETREERSGRGKTVDPAWMSNNLTAGIGGLNSFGSMVNDVYQLEYNALLNDPDQKHMLMGDFQNKALMSGQEVVVKKGITSSNSSSLEETPLDLFKKPHKYASEGSSSVNMITKKVGRMALK